MRILVVSNMYPDGKFPSYGIFVKRFVDELDALKIEHKEVVVHKKTNVISKVFSYIKFYTCTFFEALSGKYDSIYVHYVSYCSLPVLFASNFRKLKIISNVYGDDIVPRIKLHKRMLKYSKRLMDKSISVVTPSKHFSEIIRKDFGIKEDKIYCYPSCGVNGKVFFPLENIKENEIPVIGFAGRIDEGKGWDIFLKAADLALKNNVIAKFIIAGSGNKEAEFISLMEVLNLKDKITYMPMLTEEKLVEFLRNTDFFVFPSMLDESLGLTVLEAMSVGSVPIVSDIRVTSEYVNDSNGFIFKTGDSDSLYDAILKAVDSFKNKEEFDKLRRNTLNIAAEFERTKVRTILEEILKL